MMGYIIDMLYELKNVRQDDSGYRRRWFHDDYWDVIVWIEDNRVPMLQVCYGKPTDEHSLTWREDGGYSHHRIDDGEPFAGVDMTPILVADGFFDHKTVADRFRKDSANIDKGIRAFVYKKLVGYGENSAG